MLWVYDEQAGALLVASDEQQEVRSGSEQVLLSGHFFWSGRWRVCDLFAIESLSEAEECDCDWVEF